MNPVQKNKGYTQISRLLAGLIAFVFVFVSVIMSQHHHGAQNVPFAEVSIAAHSASITSDVATHSDSVHHSAVSLSTADCASCAWLATGMNTPGIVATLVATTFATIVALLLQVRLTALCAAPAPRRGLRAPPLAFA